jgi:hypothetical protein
LTPVKVAPVFKKPFGMNTAPFDKAGSDAFARHPPYLASHASNAIRPNFLSGNSPPYLAPFDCPLASVVRARYHLFPCPSPPGNITDSSVQREVQPFSWTIRLPGTSRHNGFRPAAHAAADSPPTRGTKPRFTASNRRHPHSTTPHGHKGHLTQPHHTRTAKACRPELRRSPRNAARRT